MTDLELIAPVMSPTVTLHTSATELAQSAFQTQPTAPLIGSMMDQELSASRALIIVSVENTSMTEQETSVSQILINASHRVLLMSKKQHVWCPLLHQEDSKKHQEDSKKHPIYLEISEPIEN